MAYRRVITGLLITAALLGSTPHSARASTATFTLFTGHALHFSIDYPAGWMHEPLTIAGHHFDAFLRPVRTHDFADNVNLFRSTLPSMIADDMTLLRANEDQIATQMHVHPKELGRVLVAGHTLTLMTWPEFSQAAGHLVVTQAFLYWHGWAWNFTLTTAAGDEAAMRPLFSTMLRSFQPR